MLSPTGQFNHLQGMANDAMSAIRDENESRVAQSREMRRMQHEKEIEQMRLQALISRLGQQAPATNGVINPAENLYLRFQ